MGNPDQIAGLIREVALWSLPVLAAIIFHEVAHGFVALRLGDDTAARLGRLTLNPLPHIDPVGTILLPGLLVLVGAPVFGYARPVPVDYGRLRTPRRDMVLVALAGPATNVALAALSGFVFRRLEAALGANAVAPGLATGVLVPLAQMAYYSVLVNTFLAVFNLLPIPPLDGGRVLTGVLPYAQARALASLEPFGFLIVAFLLMTHSLGAILNAPVRLLLQVLL